MLNKPGGQNVPVTSQNMSQPPMIPNVQILNMRPGAPAVAAVAAPKSVATVSPRVVIGSPQMVGARPPAPGITLQTLQSLQQGQQGHLLLKTENGQYQLLRVGPAPSAGNMAAPQGQTLRLSTVPAPSAVATASTSVAPQGQLSGQIAAGTVPAQAVATTVALPAATPPPQQPTVTTQKPLDNTKEKCRNFLANLLDLSSKEPMAVETNVRTLIQELIDAQVEPETFCERLERLLNASPQPCLIGFLKKSLPLLRQSLVTKELVIEGINPPLPHVAFSNMATSVQPVLAGSNIQLPKPAPKPSGTIAVLQNIPVHTKINVSKVGKSIPVNNKANVPRPGPSGVLSTLITPGKSLLKDKEKKSLPCSQPFGDDKMAGDDDINDVAAMGGVNLAEESQKILGSTDSIGTHIRSCKDEYFVSLSGMQARAKMICEQKGMGEPPPEVSVYLSHALELWLKDMIEKLAVIAQQRMDHTVKTDPRYEVTHDVKGQLKFLEDLDRIEKKRREDSEREMLLRAAKSRSKNEDPEQAKLKAKAKEMQRAELEEARQREANLTALQAIGPRKKPHLEAPGGSGDGAGPSGLSAPGTSGAGAQAQQRIRMKRVLMRDFLFMLEQDPRYRHSEFLYKCYLRC